MARSCISRIVVPLGTVALAAVVGAQSPPLWNATATYTAGNTVQGSDSNYYRCVYTSKNHAPTIDTGGYWELNQVHTATTLTVGVGQRFTNLLSAWNFIRAAIIPAHFLVTIKILTTKGNFTENFTSAINLDHAFGANITISGDNAQKIALNFKNSSGFVLDTGHTIGPIANLTLVGNPANSAYGVYVDSGATFNGNALVLNDFQTSVYANDGSRLICQSMNSNGFSQQAALASNHSFMDLALSNFVGNASDTYGVFADIGSTMYFGYATLSNVGGPGIECGDNSIVFATNANISGCSYGVQAGVRANVTISLGAIKNCGYGVSATFGSLVNAQGTTTQNNTIDFYLPGGVLNGSSQTNNLGADGSLIMH